jgi:hypothetical protein
MIDMPKETAAIIEEAAADTAKAVPAKAVPAN